MTKQEILEKFDNKFTIECPHGNNKGQIVLNPIFPDDIKDFISQALDRQRNDILDEVRREISNMPINVVGNSSKTVDQIIGVIIDLKHK